MPFAWHPKPSFDRTSDWTIRRLIPTIAMVAVAGCAASGELSPTSLKSWNADQAKPRGTDPVVRFQSAERSDRDGQLREAAIADYRREHWQQPADQRNSSGSPLDEAEHPVLSTGHSFVAPRVRIGRPIPLADLTETQSDSLPLDRTPWPRAAPQATPRTLPTESVEMPVIEPGDAAATDQLQPSLTSDGGAAPGIHDDQSVADTSGDVSELSEQRLETDNGTNGAAPETASASAVPSAGTLDEPTMLDRLRRGLAPPSLEDNADRVKRQLRRGLDPFGLLRDRETGTIPSASMPSAFVENTQQPLAAAMNGAASPVADPDLSAADRADVTSAAINQAIEQLQAELQSWPVRDNGEPERLEDWRRRQADLRLLHLIAGQPSDAVRIIDALPPAEQEFWQSLVLAIHDYRRPSGDASSADNSEERLDATIQHLRAATRQLQPLATLSVRRAAFCDRILGFGQTVPYPSADFDPGQRVLVYAEICNFQQVPTADGRFRSEFSAKIDFHRAGDDEAVDPVDLLVIEDICASERTDYFHSYELTVPPLSGRYQLRIRLTDNLSRRVTETQLDFNVR